MTFFKNIGTLQCTGLLLAVLICCPISTGYAMMGDDMGTYENTGSPAIPAAEADGGSNNNSNTPMSGGESFSMGESALNDDGGKAAEAEEGDGEEEAEEAEDGEDMVPGDDPNAARRSELMRAIEEITFKISYQALLKERKAQNLEDIATIEAEIAGIRWSISEHNDPDGLPWKIHLAAINLDNARTNFGPFSPQAAAAEEALDELRAALVNERARILSLVDEKRIIQDENSAIQSRLVGGIQEAIWQLELDALINELIDIIDGDTYS